MFYNGSDETLSQVTQIGCKCPIPDEVGLGSLQRGWGRWPLKVPSHLNHSLTRWCEYLPCSPWENPGLLCLQSLSLCKPVLHCQTSGWIILMGTTLSLIKGCNEWTLSWLKLLLHHFLNTVNTLSWPSSQILNALSPCALIQETQIISLKHRYFQQGIFYIPCKISAFNMQHFTDNFSAL